MRARARWLPLGLIASAATALSAAPAHAGVLVTSGVNCGTETLSQPFLPWGDTSEYTLVPGGSFEAGAPAWSLSGGAQDVAGNESFDVGGANDSQSLSLPDGSSATSPTMCVGVNEPDLRFFDLNGGNAGDLLQVSVTVETSMGGTLTVPIGTFAAGATWEPTVIDPIIANLLPVLPGQTTPVSFTFTPLGQGGNWQIDDVYVDPWNRG